MESIGKLNENGVPYLRKKDIEKIAFEYLKNFDHELLRSPVPVPVEEFIENYLQLEMDYVDITPDESVLGITIFNNGFITVYDSQKKCPRVIYEKKGTIVIENSLLKPVKNTRLRFTYGHEAGHWILHKNVFKSNYTIEKVDANIQAGLPNHPSWKRLHTDEEWMEWQANYFCSCFLMPQTTFRMAAYKLLKENKENPEYVTAYKNAYGKFDCCIADKLASMFCVSPEAAFIRLKELNILNRNAC